ncbi:MAG: DUF2961 domain-containing protein [Planctomycetota bacterium]|jgi:hypothetical protein
MKRLFWLYVICLILLSAGSTSLASFPIGYKSYTDWDKLPQLRLGAKSGLASSYDRSGGNRDWSCYEWPEGQIDTETICTVKTIQGPGIIYRFWMPHCISIDRYVVRMYFDGESTPTIDTFSDTIFDNLFSYFDAPLVTTCAGGQMCYDPIPFDESVVIETINHDYISFSDRHYYQYSYLTYPQCIDVNSWTGTLSPEEQSDRMLTVAMFENVGQNPNGNNPIAVEINIPTTTIDSNLNLADINGPGVIGKIAIKMNDANDTELQGLNLQVFYDDKSTPDINIPVAYFFGAGQQRAAYKSLPIGTDSNDGFYCYWPMPFKESVLLRLHNTTALPIDINSVKIEYEQKTLDHHTCYLHAVENTTVKSGDIYHTILSTNGQGHYVGDLLYVAQNSDSFYMLEGDDVIYSDGELVQYGTGLEDTYNGGAYYNWVIIQPGEPEGSKPRFATRPLSGILYVNKAETSRADQYRWRIVDCIPFTESIEVNVECRYSINGAHWRSVAFWYELPYLLADLNEDGIVDSKDFSNFASHWRDSDCGFADLTGNRIVDEADLVELADSWLQ